VSNLVLESIGIPPLPSKTLCTSTQLKQITTRYTINEKQGYTENYMSKVLREVLLNNDGRLPCVEHGRMVPLKLSVQRKPGRTRSHEVVRVYRIYC